ncbi:MAG: right-handed parallel beta-helix repeat-containing protein [Planctomycetota bacterium]
MAWVVAIGAVAAANAQAIWLPTDDHGRTLLPLDPQGREVFVSSSEGDDARSGLTPDTPVRTLAKALSLVRSGMPDQLLLKRGDTFLHESFGQINDATTGGPSRDRPFVIGAYGEGPRPVVTPPNVGDGSPDGLRIWSDRLSNFALVGIELRKPLDAYGGGAGISVLNPVSNIHIEDVRISGFATNVVLQGREDEHMTDVVIRRCVIEHAFVDRAQLDAHSSGLFTSNVERLLIEESVFDHNGWSATIPGGYPTKFNHNLYIQRDSVDVVVRHCVIARASAAGLQMRPGGEVRGNLFIANSDAFYLSDGQPDAAGLAIDNVVVHGSDKDIQGAISWGIDLKNNAGYRAIGNIVAHGPAGAGAALVGLEGVTARGNVVYDWGTSPDVGPADRYLDPARSIASYQQSLGAEPTIAAFLAAAKVSDRGVFDPRYTAQAVNAYFREGFTVSPSQSAGVTDAPFAFVNASASPEASRPVNHRPVFIRSEEFSW